MGNESPCRLFLPLADLVSNTELGNSRKGDGQGSCPQSRRELTLTGS